MVFFGPKLNNAEFTETEKTYLQTIGNLAAPAVLNARRFEEMKTLNTALDRKIQELRTLLELGSELNKTFEHREIIKRFVPALMGQLFVNQILIVLLDDQGEPRAEYVKGKIFTESLIGEILKNKEALQTILTEEVSKPSGVEMTIPMYIQDTWKGALVLGPKMNASPYTESDLDFLKTLVNVFVAALENAQLFKDKLARQRMEEELAMARAIQARLLPRSMPHIEGYDIHGFNIPSKQVGGDYFDIIALDEMEYLLTIADVSGKGMPAALLVSNVQAGLHILKSESYSLQEITSRLNDLIYNNTTVEKYITFFIARLNTKTHTLTYVNAGHNPPYIFRNEEDPRELDKGGLILGMMPGLSYESERINLLPGDCLVMFTDGVTEAMNDKDEPFDEHRVIGFFKKAYRKKNSKAINEMMVSELYAYAGDPTEDDDITLMTIKRNPLNPVKDA